MRRAPHGPRNTSPARPHHPLQPSRRRRARPPVPYTTAEPTSGLDSCSALSVVEHLRDRARDSGLTIVASIHQPRAAVWAAFDRCCLLSGGMLLYAGECGALVPWFESLGCGPWRADVHGTSCDWVMDLVNVGFAGKTQVGAKSGSVAGGG